MTQKEGFEFEKEVEVCLNDNIKNPKIKVIKNWEMKGISGNKYRVDFVIVREGEPIEGKGYKLVPLLEPIPLSVIECKSHSEETKTRGSFLKSMYYGYVELNDLQNHKCPKFLVVNKLWDIGRNIDFRKLFESIDVKVVEWDKSEQRENFIPMLW